MFFKGNVLWQIIFEGLLQVASLERFMEVARKNRCPFVEVSISEKRTNEVGIFNEIHKITMKVVSVAEDGSKIVYEEDVIKYPVGIQFFLLLEDPFGKLRFADARRSVHEVIEAFKKMDMEVILIA